MAGFGCLGVLAFIILIVIIGSTSDSDDKQDSKNESRANAPARATEHTKAKASPGIDKHTITKMAVNLTWQNYSEQRRDAACLGIDLYGKDWYAEQLKSDSIEPDYAAELLADKCAAR
ncbi:hypothetical protein ACGFWD_41275 [Streptomyces sp. NPDC048448]|uniref:hypothetical protein n=1 Tax=Streptomyces sp. NPDC048448 TaxID=3365554 RepID=UPI003714E612